MTFLNLKLEKKQLERILKKTNVDESVLNLKTSTGRDTVEQTTHVTPEGITRQRMRPSESVQRAVRSVCTYTMQQSSRVD